jgi:hypothetical protein
MNLYAACNIAQHADTYVLYSILFVAMRKNAARIAQRTGFALPAAGKRMARAATTGMRESVGKPSPRSNQSKEIIASLCAEPCSTDQARAAGVGAMPAATIPRFNLHLATSAKPPGPPSLHPKWHLLRGSAN